MEGSSGGPFIIEDWFVDVCVRIMGGSGGDEQFCLKWNDFHESLVTTLGDIRDEEDFVDVTLVCGSEHIRAHRLVLSACSDFFR